MAGKKTDSKKKKIEVKGEFKANAPKPKSDKKSTKGKSKGNKIETRGRKSALHKVAEAIMGSDGAKKLSAKSLNEAKTLGIMLSGAGLSYGASSKSASKTSQITASKIVKPKSSKAKKQA